MVVSLGKKNSGCVRLVSSFKSEVPTVRAEADGVIDWMISRKRIC